MKAVPEYALDANVILRYVLRDDEALFAKAERIFSAIDAGEITAVLDSVNLAEVVWVMQSFYKLSPAEIGSAMEALLLCPYIHVSEKDHYLTAIRLYADGLHHFGDACACAAAKMHCEGRLLSFDRKLGRIPGIQRHEEMQR